MAPRISASRADRMVAILDSWPFEEKLSWAAFVYECQQKLHLCYSRQALCKHWTIAEAFSRNKRRLKKGCDLASLRGLTLQKTCERIRKLEFEVQVLENANQALLEQFVRWAYNASIRGLSEEHLNQPLPAVNRNPSLVD